jgi:hypothetical protein
VVTYKITGLSGANPALYYGISQSNLDKRQSLPVFEQEGNSFKTKAVITDLQPNTVYYYKLVINETSPDRIDDSVYSFRTQTSETEVSSCTDSDGGKNPYDKGEAKSSKIINNNTTGAVDTCSGNTLYETICGADGFVQQVPIQCPNGCNDGACVKPKDTTIPIVLQLQRKITELEKQVIELEKKLTLLDNKFAAKYSGTMFLDVENKGRLWYVDPASKNRFYFENGQSALSIGSKLATGISYEDIQKIPVGIPDKLYNLKDSDNDGLPDRLESALGSDPNKADSDSDGFNDKEELTNGYNPTANQKFNYSDSLIKRLEGKMLLQVSGPNSHGEIWYIHKGQRWYGGTEDSMYEIMKARSLGATSENIRKIEVGEVEGVE